MENEKQIDGNSTSQSTKIYKRLWFWAIIGLFSVFIILVTNIPYTPSKEIPAKNNSNSQNSSSVLNSKNTSRSTNKTMKKQVTIIDFSNMSYDDIVKWCKKNKIECSKSESYSNTIAKDNLISQSVKNGEKIDEGKKITITYSLGKEPSVEFRNALKKANSYAKGMNMSKQAVFEQLTSQYGEKFSTDAAQYAMDNITADWKANALAKAKSYQERMSMSRNAIYDQLISQYGEKFTKEEAQYAIDNLEK